MATAVGCPLAWVAWLATYGQVEAQTQTGNLEEEQRLESIWLSMTLLALGLADKVGEQDNKLETLVCHFANLGGYKMLHIKVQMIVKNFD